MAPRTIGSGAYGSEISYTLSDDPTYKPLDIPGVPNTTFNNTSVIPSRESEEPVIWSSVLKTALTRYGFIVLDADISTYQAGETIPLGLYETLCAIRHRNKILRDSGINLPVPIATADETETACFERLLAAANLIPGNGYRYYFPIFSIAYAYEPTVKIGETLHEKFRAHRWFVPTPGDIGIVAWHGGRTDGIDAIFSKAKAYLGMSFSGGNYDWRSTTGEGEAISAHVNLSTGTTAGSMNGFFNKKMVSQVLPMVQF